MLHTITAICGGIISFPLNSHPDSLSVFWTCLPRLSTRLVAYALSWRRRISLQTVVRTSADNTWKSERDSRLNSMEDNRETAGPDWHLMHERTMEWIRMQKRMTVLWDSLPENICESLDWNSLSRSSLTERSVDVIEHWTDVRRTQNQSGHHHEFGVEQRFGDTNPFECRLPEILTNIWRREECLTFLCTGGMCDSVQVSARYKFSCTDRIRQVTLTDHGEWIWVHSINVCISCSDRVCLHMSMAGFFLPRRCWCEGRTDTEIVLIPKKR